MVNFPKRFRCVLGFRQKIVDLLVQGGFRSKVNIKPHFFLVANSFVQSNFCLVGSDKPITVGYGGRDRKDRHARCRGIMKLRTTDVLARHVRV